MIWIITAAFLYATYAIIKWGIRNEQKLAVVRRAEMEKTMSLEARALLPWNQPVDTTVYPNGFESGIHENNHQEQLRPFMLALGFCLAAAGAGLLMLVALQ